MPCNESLMRVDEPTASSRKERFMSIKHPLLSEIIGKHEESELKIALPDLRSLLEECFKVPNISGIRAYIATFPENVSGNTPPGKQKLLTVIFRPTIKGEDDKHNDAPDRNYWVNPNGGMVNLPMEEAKSWIDNYSKIKHQPLSDLINKQETKSIWYHHASVGTLLDDIRCYFDHGVNITGVSIAFGSYKDTETVFDAETTTNVNVDKQLTLIIVIVESKMDGLIEQKIFKFGESNQDTGIPCPPAKCP